MKTHVRYKNLELVEKIENTYHNDLTDVQNQLRSDVSWGSGNSDFIAVQALVENNKRWEKFRPKIHLVSENNPESFELEFPDKFFNFQSEGVNHFIGTIAGDVILNPKIKNIEIDDFWFSEPNDYFPGPNFGIDGVYELINADKDRPLLAYSIKPRMGYTIKQFEAIFSAAVKGGADIVEDDERMIDPEYCPFEMRVKSAARIQTQKTYYSANVTGPLDNMKKRVDIAAVNGLKFVKVDVLVTGFDALREITQYIREKKYETRITVYPDVVGHYRNLSRNFIYKMARLCGADILYAGTPWWSRDAEYTDSMIYECEKVHLRHEKLKDQKNDLVNIKPTLATMTNDISTIRAAVITHIFNRCFSSKKFAFYIGYGISSSDDITKEIKDIIRKIKIAANTTSDKFDIKPSKKKILKEEDYATVGLDSMISNYRRG